MKNQHNLLLALLGLCGGAAHAHEPFNCLRELMPITEPADFQVKRSGVEKPFVIVNKYMVFPEIVRGHVSGFYVYAGEHAWYYDALEGKPLSELKDSDFTLYEMVAQPDGLETITIKFMPGYREPATTSDGPVVLGASILPVMGAVVSRADTALKSIYHDPSDATEGELKKWIYDHSAAGKPASVKDVVIVRKLQHLTTRQKKSQEALFAPLQAEMKARKNWVQSHNLNEDSFRKLARVMESSCH